MFRAFFAIVLAIAMLATPATSSPHFYNDDPIGRDPESQDASKAGESEVGLLYEVTENLFVVSRYTPSNTRARNINTIDEVPDSSWFTNRVGTQTITPSQIAMGDATGRPPAPERWVILREKLVGANAGFTAKDANGETWFLALDRLAYPEASSGNVVAGSRLFWALGYNQVESFITTFDPAKVTIDEKATRLRPNGKNTRYTQKDLEETLERGAKNADGTYRVVAGRLLPGKVLGNFRYEGTRPDDPNDIVSHEHRRELRALRVFGAWLNLVDWKAGNTLDALVQENGRSIVKHYLQDVGTSFGMANNAHEWDMGWEHFLEMPGTKRRFLTFGFGLSPWQTVPYSQEYPSVGRFDGDHFDPTIWKPQTPTTAYMEMRADDAFWAARRVMAFSDDLIRAAVHTGEYSNPAAESYLSSVIIKRRDVIGRTYLTAINPVINPRLDGAGSLAFDNAAVAAGFADAPSAYRAVWRRFDNATGATQPIGETRSATPVMAAPSGVPQATGSFVEIDISAESAGHPSWQQPVRTYFRRDAGGWRTVGLERLP